MLTQLPRNVLVTLRSDHKLRNNLSNKHEVVLVDNKMNTLEQTDPTHAHKSNVKKNKSNQKEKLMCAQIQSAWQ